MRKRIRATALAVTCLSLFLILFGSSAVVAGSAADKHPELDKLKDANTEVTVVFKQEDLRRVLQAIERTTPKLHFIYENGVKSAKRISCSFEHVTLKEALAQLAEEHGLTYMFTAEDTILVKGDALVYGP